MYSIYYGRPQRKAEYEALIHGLRIATSLGIKRLLVYGDSAVVINQVNKIGTTPKTTWTPIVLKYKN
jgi:ribonuclease HI